MRRIAIVDKGDFAELRMHRARLSETRELAESLTVS